jgi:hypothetical protein
LSAAVATIEVDALARHKTDQRIAQRRQWCHEQQSDRSCFGGQGTEPKEQNTQQSPGFGRKSVLQLLHS